MTRSATIAILLLLACLGAWTAYVSFKAVSPIVQANGRVGSGSVGSAYTVPSLTATRHTDDAQRAAKAGAGQTNSMLDRDQPAGFDPLTAERPGVLGDKATSALKSVRPGKSSAARAPVKSAERKLNRVRLYTLTGLYTYLYTKPDKRSRRRALVNLWKKVVLTASREKNGFYYVIYTNRKGQTVNGWLPKKALRPVRLAGPVYSL